MVADREYSRAQWHDVTGDRDCLLCLGNKGATKVHTPDRTELWLGLPGVGKIALRVDATHYPSIPVQ